MCKSIVSRLDALLKEREPWEYKDNEDYPVSGCIEMIATAVKDKPVEVIEWLLDIIEEENE